MKRTVGIKGLFLMCWIAISPAMAHWSPSPSKADGGFYSLAILESGDVWLLDEQGAPLRIWPGDGREVRAVGLLLGGELLRVSRDPNPFAGQNADPSMGGLIELLSAEGEYLWSSQSSESGRMGLAMALSLPGGNILSAERVAEGDQLIELCLDGIHPDCAATPTRSVLPEGSGRIQSLDFDGARNLLAIGSYGPDSLLVMVREAEGYRLLRRFGDEMFDGPVRASWIPYGRPGAGNLLTTESLENGRSRLREICFSADCVFGDVLLELSYPDANLDSLQRLRDGHTRFHARSQGQLVELDERFNPFATHALPSLAGALGEVAALHTGVPSDESLVRQTRAGTTDLCFGQSAPDLTNQLMTSGNVYSCDVAGQITLASNNLCSSGAQATFSGSSIQIPAGGLTAESGCTLTLQLGSGTTTNPLDITNAVLTSRSGNCADYVRSYSASVNDVKRSKAFTANLVVGDGSTKCSFTSNAIPNHDFNDASASFATAVSEQSQSFEITADPQPLANVTQLSLTYDNAVFLNGVKLDLFAAACYNVGDEKIGCNDIDQPWRFDPMSPLNSFGTDSHNAHTQPDGSYHYHGSPVALFDTSGGTESAVIGFAADGFPIFGTYILDGGSYRKVTPSYRLRSGTRAAVEYGGSTWDPGGEYDGTYRDDYEYVEGLVQSIIQHNHKVIVRTCLRVYRFNA